MTQKQAGGVRVEGTLTRVACGGVDDFYRGTRGCCCQTDVEDLRQTSEQRQRGPCQIGL